MITEKEILNGIDKNSLTENQKNNLTVLLFKINQVRSKYARPMFITSGFRTVAHHIKVYKDLALKRNIEFDLSKVPMGSNHLKCAAVDILDKDGSLYKWIEENEAWLKSIGIWIEKKDDQPRVHFQIYAYKSYTAEKSIFFSA